MTSYSTFEDVTNVFLYSISGSKILSKLDDADLKLQLDHFLKRAINKFNLPKVSLSYTDIAGINTFDTAITESETDVLINHMKVIWVDYMLSDDERFGDAYFDGETKTEDQNKTIKSLILLKKELIEEARVGERNYGRFYNNSPEVGNIWGK